jgi:hypothetical protein
MQSSDTGAIRDFIPDYYPPQDKTPHRIREEDANHLVQAEESVD